MWYIHLVVWWIIYGCDFSEKKHNIKMKHGSNSWETWESKTCEMSTKACQRAITYDY